MGFDYSYTCPKIDKAIAETKRDIDVFLEEKIMEICPLLSKDTLYDLRTDWARELYNVYLESAFETVRESNEDMRRAAEKQVDDLEKEISGLQGELEAKSEEIYELVGQIKHFLDGLPE